MKLNHVLIRTTDMDEMRRFLIQVIGISQTKRPPFPFPGEWFGHEGKAFVHVIEAAHMSAGAGPVAHVAIEGADYVSLRNRLVDNAARYSETDVPQSGEHQVFVAGPDGLTVEMLFPMGIVNSPEKNVAAMASSPSTK